MLRIGITGGIGSGKSVVCHFFERHQIPIYNADDEGNKIIDTDAIIRRNIIAYFGAKAYTQKGLNKPLIRKLVFGKHEALQKLNAITHPVIIGHFDEWCVRMKKQGHLLVVKEAALMFESESYKSLDFIACVVAPIETRIARVIQRDGKSRDEVMRIINKQWSDVEKIKRSDYIIYNDDTDLVLPQLVDLHTHVIHKSRNHGN